MKERELPLPSRKKKTKVALINKDGKDKILNLLLVTLVCCLMMARRLHVCEMDLKLAALWKILLAIMMSFSENVHSSKRLTVVVAFALCFLGLATHYHES